MRSLLNRHRHVFSNYKWKYLRVTDTDHEKDSYIIDKIDDHNIIYLYNFDDPEKEFITAVFSMAILQSVKNKETSKLLEYLQRLLDEINEPITNNMLVYSLKFMANTIEDGENALNNLLF